MSKSIKREIIVLGKKYYWTLKGNTVHGYKETHIKIHADALTKSILYLDPYKWHFQIRPKTIEQSILFAKNNGWIPEEKGTTTYLSMNDDGTLIYATGASGTKYGYLDKEE